MELFGTLFSVTCPQTQFQIYSHLFFKKNKKQEDISSPDLLDNSGVGDLLMKYIWLSFSSSTHTMLHPHNI